MTSNGQPCSCCTPRPELDPLSSHGCPRCGVRSQHRVKAVTLRALLLEPEQSLVSQDDYRLCLSPACPVVYFDPAGGAAFSKDQLSVRVGFKEGVAPRPLCYCFDHSWESLREEWLATGQSTVAASIRETMRSAGCHCEETNPKGVCCLADVAEALSQIQAHDTARHLD